MDNSLMNVHEEATFEVSEQIMAALLTAVVPDNKLDWRIDRPAAIAALEAATLHPRGAGKVWKVRTTRWLARELSDHALDAVRMPGLGHPDNPQSLFSQLLRFARAMHRIYLPVEQQQST
ncbi:hypothetical protein [Kineococcus glutinatus]